LKEFYHHLKEMGQPIERIADHGISLGIYLRDPDGNGVEVFYEMPRAEWPVDYHVFTREKTGRGRFPGPWDAEVAANGPPAQPVAAQ
jgi:catechol 2,3-dioxygenase